MDVKLFPSGKDYHGEECDCGLCNSNGHSYGVEIVPVTDCEPVDVVYGASEQAAMEGAKSVCALNKWNIVQE